ncbi:MAG TPA: S53 family peptidase, partial [Candidatus Binataceae bacterium]|nr:S53 family peptidase [Candidatus Binataceae bacterium]
MANLRQSLSKAVYLVALLSGIWLLTPRAASAQTVQLQGNVTPQARAMASYGDAASSRTMPIQVWFKPRNQAALNALIAAQQNPSSPSYRKWITPKEYARRFAPTRDQFNAVARWLTSQGFQVTSGSPETGVVNLKGSVGAIDHAFNVRIAKFSADGTRFANIGVPEIPAEYGNLIARIGGLDNLHASIAASHDSPSFAGFDAPARAASSLTNRQLAMAESPDTIVANIGPYLGPSDFYTFYDETPLTNAGTTGSGCIAVVGDSDFRPGPLSTFNTQFGLPDNSASVTTVLADGASPGVNSDEVETLIDLEWSHAVAPGAAQKYFLGNGSTAVDGAIVDALQAAVNDGACPVITVSFALCGGGSSYYTSTVGNIVAQAQVQGQSIVVAAGDWGAAGVVFNGTTCAVATSPNVNELASNPLITSVGGTSFDRTAFNGAAGTIAAHTTERAWNDSDDPTWAIYGGDATGGGASAFFPKPDFQNGVTPGDGARDQPDVALTASPNYPGAFVYLDNGSGGSVLRAYGGTSLSTPMWAGIINLAAQASGANIGSINSLIYKMAGAGQSAAGFYDITIGDN